MSREPVLATTSRWVMRKISPIPQIPKLRIRKPNITVTIILPSQPCWALRIPLSIAELFLASYRRLVLAAERLAFVLRGQAPWTRIYRGAAESEQRAEAVLPESRRKPSGEPSIKAMRFGLPVPPAQAFRESIAWPRDPHMLSGRSFSRQADETGHDRAAQGIRRPAFEQFLLRSACDGRSRDRPRDRPRASAPA